MADRLPLLPELGEEEEVGEDLELQAVLDGHVINKLTQKEKDGEQQLPASTHQPNFDDIPTFEDVGGSTAMPALLRYLPTYLRPFI
jgi:hypothetical protein